MKRIIGVVLLCVIIGVVSYFGTLYLDKLKKDGDVNVTVTFDDTETFKLESVKKMDKENGAYPV